MKSYKPDEHEETKSVAPLLQFFELVHIGDTMQSMIHVYFDKELVGGVRPSSPLIFADLRSSRRLTSTGTTS